MLVYQRVSLHNNHGKATTDIPISKRQCVGCYTARIQFLNFTSFAIGETNSNDENRQSTLETHEPANLQHRKLLCMFCQSAGLNCNLTCCLTFEANRIRSFHFKSSIGVLPLRPATLATATKAFLHAINETIPPALPLLF